MSEFSMNSKDFYKALTEGQLIGTKCADCGSFAVPQRRICPKCHSENNSVVSFSGEGSLAAYTVISVPPAMMADAGYDAKNPYCVGIVELVEGPRVSAQILEVNMHAPEEIKIGTKMRMTTITRGEGENLATFLAFKPV